MINAIRTLVNRATTMPKTTLIQRLRNPDGRIHHSFGGGMKNGGVSMEDMEVIKNIWAFDYMGNVHFEYGAVAEALQRMKDYAKEGRAYTGEVISLKVPFICEKGEEDEVQERIHTIYERKFDSDNVRPKENPFFREAMTVDKEPYNQFGGWLELDNGFMFFKSRKMYNDTLAILG
jgi:hypothetical protein